MTDAMRANLYTIPNPASGRLSIMPRPRGGDWLEDEISTLREAGVDALVSLLTPAEVSELDLAREEGWCVAHGLLYRSLPIPDFGVPPSHREVARLLTELADLLAQEQHVVIHCRGGVGRSSVMAASLLALLGTPPARAFEIIAAARGRAVPETAEQRAWVEAFAESLRDGGDGGVRRDGPL